MKFEHAANANYEDLASGNVLHSAPGYPAFPVRLALELFERARRITGKPRVGVWDPLCGAGSIVTTLGLLRADAITRILATDISEAATVLAEKNLVLLSERGLTQRAEFIARRSADRAAAAERLLHRQRYGGTIATQVAVADATHRADLQRLPLDGIDIVITDLPYGVQTAWSAGVRNPSVHVVQQLRESLPDHAVIVVCSTLRRDFQNLPTPVRAFKHGPRIIKFYRAG